MTSALDRLSKLKKLKKQSEIDNRKEVQKEHDTLRTNHKLLIRLNERQAKAQEELDKLEAKSKGEEYDRKNAWKWTIEQVEKWDEKQKPNLKSEAGFQSFKQLAEQTYKKELLELKTDEEIYEEQKKKFEEFKQSYRKKQKHLQLNDSMDETKLMEQFIIESSKNNKDKSSRHYLNKLVESIHKSDDRKLKRRRTEEKDTSSDSTIGYINEKNKQFNAKLNRHYDSLARKS